MPATRPAPDTANAQKIDYKDVALLQQLHFRAWQDRAVAHHRRQKPVRSSGGNFAQGESSAPASWVFRLIPVGKVISMRAAPPPAIHPSRPRGAETGLNKSRVWGALRVPNCPDGQTATRKAIALIKSVLARPHDFLPVSRLRRQCTKHNAKSPYSPERMGKAWARWAREVKVRDGFAAQPPSCPPGERPLPVPNEEPNQALPNPSGPQAGSPRISRAQELMPRKWPQDRWKHLRGGSARLAKPASSTGFGSSTTRDIGGSPGRPKAQPSTATRWRIAKQPDQCVSQGSMNPQSRWRCTRKSMSVIGRLNNCPRVPPIGRAPARVAGPLRTPQKGRSTAPTYLTEASPSRRVLPTGETTDGVRRHPGRRARQRGRKPPSEDTGRRAGLRYRSGSLLECENARAPLARAFLRLVAELLCSALCAIVLGS